MNHLPESLQAQLKAAQRRLWMVETAVAILGGICGLLFAFLVLFISDRFWETPPWLRFTSTATGIIGAALGAWWWASHYTRRRDLKRLAQLVQKRFRRFGDRLLSVVELSEPANLPENISRQLVDAAMSQVATEAEKFNFREAVPTRSLRRWTPVFIVAAGLGIAALTFTPMAARNTFMRWLKPAAEVERYTFTKLNPLESRRIVPYGEPFAVEARLKEDSEWTPPVGRARVERQNPVTAREQARAYGFKMPGQTRTGTLAVAIGDARETADIVPVYRPDLAALVAEVNLPEYLGRPPQPLDILKGSLEVVEGSQAIFTGRVSRALSAATHRTAETGDVPAVVQDRLFITPKMAFASPTGQVTFAWKDNLGLEGRQPFTLGILTKPDAPPMVDCTGLRRTTAIIEDEVLSIPVRAEDDFGVKHIGLKWEFAEAAEGPVIQQGSLDVAKGGVMDSTLEATTRFAPAVLGIRPGRVQLVATTTDFHPTREAVSSAPYTIFILDKAEHARLVHRQLEQLQGRLEDLVRAEEQQLDETRRLAGEADNQDVKRTTEQIREASRAEAENRAALRRLREDFQKLSQEALRNTSIAEEQIKQMADVTEQAQNVEQQEMRNAEQALENAAQAEQSQQEQQKQLEQLQKQLQELQKKMEELQKQAPGDQQKQQMQQMQQQMQQMQQQAPQATPQQMGQMQQQMQQMQQQMQQMQQQSPQSMQQQMQQAQQQMQQAQRQMEEMQKRAQELARAQEEQQKALEKLRAAMEKLNKASEELLADNFTNRLKSLARAEKEINSSITNVLPRTIGQRFEDMPADVRDLIRAQEANQRQIQKRTKGLATDMEYFLKRAAAEEVEKVRLEMEQTNVVDRLGSLADLLTVNKLVQAQDETAGWEKQFLAWADMLKKRKKGGDGKGQGQPQEQKEMSPEMIELILKLLRIRQSEQDLRESTRALDDLREIEPKYAERARMLAAKQGEIRDAFRAAPEEAKVSQEELEQMYELLDAVEFAMDDSEAELKKPETGGPAVGAQTEVIELLSPQEQEQDPKTGKPKPQQGQMSAQMMAMMQQMQKQMGMQSGKKPGPMGSMAGGSTDQASPFGKGTADAGRGEREVEKAGGRNAAVWPTEYRDAIEAYFNAVESE